MKEFQDINGYKVELSFKRNAFCEKTGHVLAICVYKGKWLLTKHGKRGLEFPGGKVEPGETLEEAARREVLEETGGVLGQLYWLADYRVTSTEHAFVKAVFFGKVEDVQAQDSYFETVGPHFVDGSLGELRFGEDYSFIMKDRVIGECLERIREQKLLEK
ncbi:RNA deprotection pyrophosphohydrolase [Bacillus sp. FJAT-27445]|uniref:RNA deprotection pyrophosphohydrolase n=1 Tax=Bacillus sp. FJAT-27445 TaxID=1679166 RepID=UPI0007439464|nr:nucleoside triphosphatase YtkD [Bacillus sp. FJAT-27445]